MKAIVALFACLLAVVSANSGFTLRNKELEFVNSTVFLGITLDDRLQWGPHISKLVKRLSSATYAVKKMRNLSDIETARLVYFSCFHSLMSYGILLWGNGYFGYSENFRAAEAGRSRNLQAWTSPVSVNSGGTHSFLVLASPPSIYSPYIRYPNPTQEAGNALVTPPRLKISMGGGDILLLLARMLVCPSIRKYSILNIEVQLNPIAAITPSRLRSVQARGGEIKRRGNINKDDAQLSIRNSQPALKQVDDVTSKSLDFK
ncbi:hypothetical protein EVAR_16881_1 [Eumeta japonica]|uniref:Uncharacterized protein n=1 Tax=Eumeta variegata TaxID=151549 RepID=A0A4C1V366_EUMVA|nr:hypothetical protein EVAR_16881_1 [Eumeta japonica]